MTQTTSPLDSSSSTTTPTVLGQAELIARGMRQVTAYVPDEAELGIKKAKSDSSAERMRRAREKAAADGLRQLNVAVPTEVHDALKNLAKALKEGDSWQAALGQALAQTRQMDSRTGGTVTGPLPRDLARHLIHTWHRLLARLRHLVSSRPQVRQ